MFIVSNIGDFACVDYKNFIQKRKDALQKNRKINILEYKSVAKSLLGDLIAEKIT